MVPDIYLNYWGVQARDNATKDNEMDDDLDEALELLRRKLSEFYNRNKVVAKITINRNTWTLEGVRDGYNASITRDTSSGFDNALTWLAKRIKSLWEE